MQTYGDWNYQNQPFVMPSDTFELVSANKQDEQAYEEELIEEAENTAIAAPTIEISFHTCWYSCLRLKIWSGWFAI